MFVFVFAVCLCLLCLCSRCVCARGSPPPPETRDFVVGFGGSSKNAAECTNRELLGWSLRLVSRRFYPPAALCSRVSAVRVCLRVFVFAGVFVFAPSKLSRVRGLCLCLCLRDFLCVFVFAVRGATKLVTVNPWPADQDASPMTVNP